MVIKLTIVWTLRIVPRHQSTDRDISSVNITSSVMPYHQSVYVNSVVNSNVDSTVFDRPEFKSDVCFAI
ncbi:hypothetical protein CUMW_267020 [Citrus unshiu]|uniref:Uncharacterized protein n=1 Tax=Citrus unshiu TaxID=55188 RepID=A0A2H5QW05_CITUN|nr:hypothetical protein CUMW_267020 [Citrus unshiu]